MNRLVSTIALASVTAAALTGCGPRFTAEPAVDAFSASGPEPNLRVEAYLYDVRIRRDGKLTSLRLELFQTDSVVAMGGRGYLGKGALKGRLTSDSVEVYFPSRREYLYEAVRDLLFASSCTHGIPQLDFPALLRSLPTDEDFGAELVVRRSDSDDEHPRFILTWADCTWEMELTYDERDSGWRLDEVKFDGGAEISFTAKRRAHKPSTTVGRKKFDLPAEPDYLRITP